MDRQFDVIFFSYVLSMVPSWPTALGTALAHLAAGGRLTASSAATSTFLRSA